MIKINEPIKFFLYPPFLNPVEIAIMIIFVTTEKILLPQPSSQKNKSLNHKRKKKKKKKNNFSSRYFTMYNFGASPSALPLLFLLPSSPLLSQLDFFTRASWRTPFGLPERVRGTFSGFLARPLSPSLLFFFFSFLF